MITIDSSLFLARASHTCSVIALKIANHLRHLLSFSNINSRALGILKQCLLQSSLNTLYIGVMLYCLNNTEHGHGKHC